MATEIEVNEETADERREASECGELLATNCRELYTSVNKMMAEIGVNTKLHITDDCVTRVMDALHRIDGGTFNEALGS